MNKSWLCAAALVALLTSGCGLVETPNELMRAPSTDNDQKTINQAIMQYLPAGAQLTVPLNPDDSSAVSLRDLDADGTPEAVAFYTTDKNDYEIGVLILTQIRGQWEKLASFTSIGNQLDYVQFVDLTGDRISEILIGLGGGDDLNRELSVYTLNQGTLHEQMKQPYSVLAVGDLDGNDQPELALVLHDHNQFTSSLTLYGARDQQLVKLDEQSLEGTINGYEQALIGKASADKNGLFIEAGLGAHSAYTELWLWENGKLHNPFANAGADGGMVLTFKPYPLYSEDVNQDGIIEIGIQTQPPGSDELAMAFIPWISSYYQWDGNNGLTHVVDHYRNYSLGFDFKIPAKWADSFTVSTEPESEPRKVHFYYYDENSGEKALLLTLQAVEQQEWSKAEAILKQQNQSYVLVKEAGKTVHVAIIPGQLPNLSPSALQLYMSMKLTHDEIREHYRPLRFSM